MDNEFEIVNESIPESNYQAVPEQPAVQYQQQTQYEPSAAQPKKKKNGCLKIVIAAVVVVALAFGCSVFGGLIGALGMGIIMYDDPEIPDDDRGGHVDVQEGDRESTIIDINKVDTNKLMTPAEVYALNVESTVGITTAVNTNYWGYASTTATSGSGFVYSEDGYIITNFHVIEDTDSVSVFFYDGTSMEAKVVGYDESNDIAVLKVEAENLKPVILGNSENINVGDTVLAIGNPLGELTFSLTAGTVSALDREVTFSGGLTMNLIQTDCAINSGNSGGAMFNLYGEVIGITNAKYSGSSGGGATIDNIGFAIPLNQVRTLIDSIIEKGYAVKPYIGVTVTDVSQESLGYGLPEGASVQDIVRNGPAAEAGLKISDIITHINGEKISGAWDLKKTINSCAPGDKLKLTVFRKGDTISLTITVGEQSPNGTVTPEPETIPEETDSQRPEFPFFDWDY